MPGQRCAPARVRRSTTTPLQKLTERRAQGVIRACSQVNPGYEVVLEDDADMWASVRRAAPSLLPLFALLRPVERADLWRACSPATPCVLAPACSAVYSAGAPRAAPHPPQSPAHPAPPAARWARCRGLPSPLSPGRPPWHAMCAPARPLRGRRA